MDQIGKEFLTFKRLKGGGALQSHLVVFLLSDWRAGRVCLDICTDFCISSSSNKWPGSDSNAQSTLSRGHPRQKPMSQQGQLIKDNCVFPRP